MKKENQRIKTIKSRVENITNSFDYKVFENDRQTCLADWQYYESIDLTNNERFELDKEAYIKAFFDGDYGTESVYKEDIFIQILINQIKEPKHPIFIEYLDYLKLRKNEIKTDGNNFIKPPKDYQDIFLNIEDWNIFTQLVRMIVNKEDKKYNHAEFSVIFQTLIDTKVILKQKHKKYLDFCDKNFETDFSKETKLKSNTSDKSTRLIKNYLNSVNRIKL